jgi:hypothetical protein
MKIQIRTNDLAALRHEVSRLNRKGARYGWQPTIITELEQNLDTGVLVSTVKIELGQHNFEGWKFVAQREKDNGLSVWAEELLPVRFAGEEKWNCEHCNLERRRNTVFFFVHEETGATIKVGSSCLEDFSSGGVAEYAAMLNGIAKHARDFQEELGKSLKVRGEAEAYDTQEFLSASVQIIEAKGFASASERANSTAQLACKLVLQHQAGEDYIFASSVDTAKMAFDFIANKKRNSFEETLFSRISQRFLRNSDLNIAVYAAKIFADSRNTAVSEYVGMVGDKLELTLKVVASDYQDFGYGPTYQTKLVDEHGNVFVWYAAEKQEGEFKVKAKVKGHKEFRGVKSTQINYVKKVGA